MQNLLKFIQKFSNFLLFIPLEVAAFLLIVKNTAYPQSTIISTCNTFVAWHYELTDNIHNYFHLKESNEQLQQENAILRNQLVLLANRIESDKEKKIDYKYANIQHHFIPAKVIHMTIGNNKNFLTINKGHRDGITKGMGVLGPLGIVGVVETVGQQFSIVIPIINNDGFGVSCRLQKNGQIGTLKWDESDNGHAILQEVERHIEVNKGDVILTSGLSATFPENLPVGIVDSAEIENGQSSWTIHVKLCTDFNKLSYVQVIDNDRAKKELEQLEKNKLELD